MAGFPAQIWHFLNTILGLDKALVVSKCINGQDNV